MDKGIRPACNAKFLSELPARVNTKAGNTLFRKTVMHHIMEEFGATLASAATHYNHAFLAAKELAKTDATLATQLEGLGRPEDKKGGRKPKAVTPPAVSNSVIPVPVNSILQNFINAGVVQGAPAATTEAGDTAQAVEEAPQGAVLLSEGIKENTSVQTVTINPPALFSVYKVAKGTLVAEGLTREQADELVAKAKAAKKAQLEVR